MLTWIKKNKKCHKLGLEFGVNHPIDDPWKDEYAENNVIIITMNGSVYYEGGDSRGNIHAYRGSATKIYFQDYDSPIST